MPRICEDSYGNVIDPDNLPPGFTDYITKGPSGRVRRREAGPIDPGYLGLLGLASAFLHCAIRACRRHGPKPR